MRPALHPRTVNGPFGDPGVFVSFQFRHRAILFDLGDIVPLSPRDILSISHVFVSHAHMDHFYGFDRLLRLHLGRSKVVRMYGPEGFLEHVAGRLSGYAWNLVHQYDGRFRLQAVEVTESELRFREYPCQERFRPGESRSEPFTGTLLSEPGLTVETAILDHDIPCLAFALSERFHINVLGGVLDDMGLRPGPWLQTLKEAIHAEAADDTVILADEIAENAEGENGGGARRQRACLIGALRRDLVRITPGQKIAYVTDALYSPSNARRIVDLVRGADRLFIEAAFLERDRDLAAAKRHLTAWQAGTLAGMAGVRDFDIFHVSPRYDDPAPLLEEARRAYTDARSGAMS